MKYSKKLVEQICTLVASGDQRIVDVCKQVGISEDTFYEWKKTKSEFSEALKKAETQRLESFRTMARTGLASRLVDREVEEVHTEYVDKAGKPVIKGRRVVKKLILADTAAIIFTLKNTDPDNFRDKQQVDLQGDLNIKSEVDYSKLSKEALREVLDATKPEQS